MGRSIVDQVFLLKKETVPGTPNTTGMQQFLGLKLMPGHNDDGDDFRASGYRTVTAHTPTDEYGTHDVTLSPCFNALTPVAASVLSDATPTQPDAANAPTAYQWVFTLLGKGALARDTFTAQWGDDVVAGQFPYFRFQNLGLSVERGALDFSSAGISREADWTVTLASTPTVIPAVPIAARGYDIWIDDSWATLGTTKYLACYHAEYNIGDLWQPDSPINSAISSFEALVEGDEVDYSGSMQVGLDAAATDLIADYKAGAVKYVRIATTGPLIAGTTHYSLQLDFAIQLTARGTVGTAPNSPTVILPFDYVVTTDAATGKSAELTLVNTVSSL